MVRTRIAPSPTGDDIHIGNLYTALINWTYAHKHNGQFLIRIEDTDRERYIAGAEEKILNTLKAFGLTYDEGPDIGGPHAPYRQSERLASYRKFAEELVEKGNAYYCFCTKERLDELRKDQLSKKQMPRYDRYCLQHQTGAREKVIRGERHVIRMKVPEGRELTFHDVIRGPITVQSASLDDQVLLKSDGFPTYHLAVVIDDHAMNITHVIRAEEWISSTPKHILLYEFFAWDLPIFAHVPILRNPDRSKLSKRKNPVWASWYLEQGYLPEAILNYLALMGWSHPEEKEVFTREEFTQVFDIKDIKAVGPAFDRIKLEWMNGEYIRKMDPNVLLDKIFSFYGGEYPRKLIEKTIPLIQERIKKLSDYLPITEFFFRRPVRYEVDLSQTKGLLLKIGAALESITEWKAKVIGESMQNLAVEMGVKNSEFFMILRVAMSGKKISPPLNESMEIMGKDECIGRISLIASL